MAGDIVQRGLNLEVQADDLASGTLQGVADELEQLQARAEQAFGAIAMSGENAASSLADSANLFAPEWESQLEALQSFADGVFAGMGDSVSVIASSMSESAATVSEAWLSALDDLKGGTDTAIGSLDGLQGDMESTAEVADSTAGDIAEAYSGDALALDAGAGSLDNLQSQMETTAGTAASTAGDISGSYDADALALDAGTGSLKTLQSEMKTTSKTATTTAGDIGKQYSTNTLKLDAGTGSLKDLRTAMDTTVETAKADAKAIEDAFAGVGVTTGATGAEEAAAGATAGRGGTPGIGFGNQKGGSKGFKLPSLSLASLMTGGITAALGLGAVDLGIGQLEGLEALKAQTGLSWTQTLTTAAAARGVGLGTDQIQRLIQRLDTNIGKLTQADVAGAHTVEGKAVSMGFGRQGIDPSTLKSVLGTLAGGGSGGAALALKTLGIGPGQLVNLSAEQQLALIATKLDGIKNNTLRTATINELFGRGTDTANLLEKFTLATTEAQKNLPKGLAKDLQMTLGSGGKSMVDLQEQMFYLEVEMSASLMKMVPLLSKLLGEASKHTTLLMDLAIGGAASGGLNKVLEHEHGGSTIGSIIKHVVKSGAAKVGGAAAGTGVAARVAGYGGDLAGYGAELLSKALGPIGIGTALLANPDSMANDTSKFALMWQHVVAPHVGTKKNFTQKDSVQAIQMAARIFGLNPAAMLSDSYAEASLNPHAFNKSSGATGIFQFIPSTWASDTKKILGQSLPQSSAANPWIAAFIAAASMRRSGTGTQHNSQTALADMLKNFENPGGTFNNPKTGLGGDWQRGIPFLQTIENDLNKASTTAKTKAPQVKQPLTQMLQQLVTEMTTHGKQFSTGLDVSLLQAEKYLKDHKAPFNTAGKELMKGLEQGLDNELPYLRGQVKKIADELEATLKAALKVHSPSEMTAEIGENLMAGLGLGMQRGTSSAAQVAAASAMQVVGGLGTPTAGLSLAGGEQTIIIMFDSAEVARAVNRQQHGTVKMIAKLP
jgi:hypothetical protein